MSQKPLINAISALLYIIFVALIMFYASKHMKYTNAVVLVPIAIVSLFTLSASIMGYIFLYQPIILYLDGKKKKAVKLFIHTVIFFAILTAFVFILLFSGILF